MESPVAYVVVLRLYVSSFFKQYVMCLKRINWFKIFILKESFPWRTLHKMLKLYEKWVNGEIIIHKLHIEQTKNFFFFFLGGSKL